MAEKFNFTQQRLEKLPLPRSGRKDYYDTDVSKLICRISASGNKSFCVTKRGTSGKLQRVTLGKWPDVSVAQARKLAIETLSTIANGITVNDQKRKQRYRAITLQELFDLYLEDKKELRSASVLDYTKKLNQGFSDWLKKPINEITPDMVKSRRNSITGGRDNKMRVLRLLMHYAVALKAIDQNPVDILKEVSLWAKPKRKARIIPAEKLHEWYTSVLNLDNQKAKIYLLMLLYTGIRSSEALYLEWSDVDFKKNTFLVRDTKNHSDFTVQMSAPLKPYLKSLQQITGKGKYVFPGDRKDGTMDIPRKPILRVGEEIGMEFSSHDLRRTFATIAEATLLPETIIKRLLNHTMDNDVTTGYINTEAETLAQATEKIADYIHSKVYAQSNVAILKRNSE